MAGLIADIYGNNGPQGTTYPGNAAPEQQQVDWITKTLAAQQFGDGVPESRWNITSTPTPGGGGGSPSTAMPSFNDVVGSLALGDSRVASLPDGRQVLVGKDMNGKVTTQPLSSGATDKGSVQDLGNGFSMVTQPNGEISLVKTSLAGSGGGAAAQFDWGKTAEAIQGGWANAEAMQRLQSESAEGLARLQGENALNVANANNEAGRLVSQLQADSAAAIARIQGDTTLNAKQKDVEIARVNVQGAKDAAEASASAQRYVAELNAAEEKRRTDAQIAIANGQTQLGYAQMQSAERIAAAKAQIEREIAGLTAYTQLLGIESTERASKAQSAASVFKSLAEAAPADQLRSAWYFTRGQAPPPTLSEKMPSGLLSALGMNPDTVTAAARQMSGQVSVPPFLANLMSGQMAPK